MHKSTALISYYTGRNNLVSKPNILISKCLGFGRCRYDGGMIRNTFINKLKQRVNFIPVCPEAEIGLGTPRAPIILIMKNGRVKMIQPDTKTELTKRMREFSRGFMKKNRNIHGAILKSKSPSCGIKNVKLYKDINKKILLSIKGTGIFAAEVLRKLPSLPVFTA